jgi:hypothetical protein
MNPMDAFATAEKLSIGEFGENFGAFRTRAFRLECLPIYHVESEAPALEAFRAGAKKPPADFNADWIKILKDAAQRGAYVQRVRLLPSIPTEYVRFECEWGYKRQIPLGERVLFLTPEHSGELEKWPIGMDYWLFDDRSAYFMVYDFFGRFMGVLKPNKEWTARLAGQANELIAAAHDITCLESYLT